MCGAWCRLSTFRRVRNEEAATRMTERGGFGVAEKRCILGRLGDPISSMDAGWVMPAATIIP
jgi:hypothetical protein